MADTVSSRQSSSTLQVQSEDADSSVHQLQPFDLQTDNENVSSLPPVDTGKHAWLFLASAFVVEGLVWGFVLSFGVIQEYYSTHAPFEGAEGISTVGTTASGTMYFIGILWFAMGIFMPTARLWVIRTGPFLLAASLVGASYATTVNQLIATQGVLYALGGSMVHVPTIALLDEWFAKRKGLAYGIMWAGTGTAGLVIPVALGAGLERFGAPTVLRAYAALTLAGIVPFLPFIKPRLPPSRKRRINFAFLSSPQFWGFQAGNVIQGLGYFVPSIYLPTYARGLGASGTVATLTLVVMNVASVLGSVFIGGMTDRFHVSVVIAVSSLGSALASFLLWGFSANLPTLFAFCAAYGLFAGGYSSTWPGVLSVLRRKVRQTDNSLMLGFLAAGRGVGNVVSGPISEMIMQAGTGAWSYGDSYGPLIVFVGTTSICGGLAILLRAKPGFT